MSNYAVLIAIVILALLLWAAPDRAPRGAIRPRGRTLKPLPARVYIGGGPIIGRKTGEKHYT